MALDKTLSNKCLGPKGPTINSGRKGKGKGNNIAKKKKNSNSKEKENKTQEKNN